MSNPLYGLFGNQQPNPNPMSGLMQKFQQFRKNFSGNPEEMAKNMMRNGQLNQDQVRQLTQMTNQFFGLFNTSK